MTLPDITKVEKIDVQDGDVLVVFIKGYCTAMQMEQLKFEFEHNFLPKVVKVAFVNAEVVEMKVMRAQ